MTILSFLKNNIIILDGAMGTLLQERGLTAGEAPEKWNVTHPDEITAIHRAYLEAGSNAVCTNTFGVNGAHYSEEEINALSAAAVENARKAVKESGKEAFVLYDIGPTGRLLKPYGDFDFEDAVSAFAQSVRAAHGVDGFFIETMNDSYETKAALLAVKENSDLPVFVCNAYGADGKLMTGATPAAMAALLEGMGADAVGANCSLGPKALSAVVDELLSSLSVPTVFKPNAGLPRSEGNTTVFDVSPDEFAADILSYVEKGVRIVGGCCGTTPSHISALSKALRGVKAKAITEKNISCISSYTHAVTFGEEPILIGERINPTGKKRFKEALRANDMPYLLNEGLSQQEKGVHVLDVNVGLPEIDEKVMLTAAVCELQAVSDLPLQIDTTDISAMESALRRYNGKALINSVNGKEESMRAVFPLLKKYGGMAVALTLDENGIPATAEGRLQIAKKILLEAEKFGIQKKDILFDPLALTVSADKNAALETLKAVKLIREELGCFVSLGVSNVSFGLPNRDGINSTFFAMALENGLSAAIMNPYSLPMMSVYFSFRALHGLDENCADYLAFSSSDTAESTAVSEEKSIRHAVIKGLKERAAALTEQSEGSDPMLLVQEEIIPALDEVGKGFEAKKIFLPQLLMSAEAAKAAFEVIKKRMSAATEAGRGPIVLATVHGDIHDIGKNIVRLLLENYGFAVKDLGRDVPPETVAQEAVRLHAPLVGLSALMTTTVPAMEETIKMLRKEAPWCKIVVGGAVLTQEYADLIGADRYAKDAMETVRYAESIC